jgi:predicted DCC family thiol-disulfide oxidoreductase YuxK
MPGAGGDGGAMSEPPPVLLFDGECGLCNAQARFLLRRDRARRLRFATLQGNYGQAALRRLGLPTGDFDSLVFLPRGEAGPGLLRTDGALAAMSALGGGWARLARCLRRVPAGSRDGLYRVVARTRYAIFGRHRGPPLWSDPAWAGRFYD